MHKHLQMVRAFHDKFAIDQPDYPETQDLSTMDIVMRQSLLFNCGSDTFQSIAEGDLLKTLGGLVDLAYNALAAIACRGDDVIPVSVSWRQDGSILSVTRALSEKIHQCHSGETRDYSALYALCVQLSKGFINADFDQAFQMVHDHLMGSHSGYNDSASNYQQKFQRETLPAAPDLSDALYE